MWVCLGLPAALAVVPNLFPSADTCVVLNFERGLLWLRVSGFVEDLGSVLAVGNGGALRSSRDRKMRVGSKLHHGATQVLVIIGKPQGEKSSLSEYSL